MLRNNPQLESLDVTYSSPSPSQSALTHRSLRRLVTSEPDLIRCLTLTNLEELVVEAEEDTILAIRALLQRSKCTLRSLRLIEFILDEVVLAVLSSSNHSLRTLAVRLTDYDAEVEETMELLVQKLAEPSFLPYLEELDIVISQDEDLDSLIDDEEDENEDKLHFATPTKPSLIGFVNDAFVEMLAARWDRRRPAQRGAHLKQAIVLIELPSPAVGLSKTRGVDRLRKMCDEGLDVVIRARDSPTVDFNYDISYVYGV